jgi:hypothetical protein
LLKDGIGDKVEVSLFCRLFWAVLGFVEISGVFEAKGFFWSYLRLKNGCG